jgi:enterochelin esterase-like enzyme
MQTVKKRSVKSLIISLASFIFLVAFACSKDEPATYRLTLIHDGGGTVESEKNAYLSGESVSVTAIPDEGFHFNSWYEGENRISDFTAYSFLMPDKDLTLRAIFTTMATEPPAEGTVNMSQSITSRILGGTQQYTVYLPPGYNHNPERKYPVLYLLHGYGGGHTSWATGGNLKNITDEAIINGTCKELIIVCPDGYNSFYCNGYISGMNYEDFFINEFIPAIESTYRINAVKAGRAIAGLSMGGYGATFHALKRPEMFGSCFAMSGAFIGGIPPIGQFVTGRTAAELSEYPAFVMECGTEDNLVVSTNDDLHEILTEAGFTHIYTKRPGVHDWSFWRVCLPKALKLASDNFE